MFPNKDLLNKIKEEGDKDLGKTVPSPNGLFSAQDLINRRNAADLETFNIVKAKKDAKRDLPMPPDDLEQDELPRKRFK